MEFNLGEYLTNTLAMLYALANPSSARPKEESDIRRYGELEGQSGRYDNSRRQRPNLTRKTTLGTGGQRGRKG